MLTFYGINEYIEKSSSDYHLLSLTAYRTSAMLSPIYHVGFEFRLFGLGFGAFVVRQGAIQ